MTRSRFGQCPLCERECALTRHHLIPRKLHRRTRFRKHYDRATLAQSIDICRQCHDGIHHFYDEMTLAKSLSTLELLLADETLLNHYRWVARQRRRFA